MMLARLYSWSMAVWVASAVYAVWLSVESIRDHEAFTTGLDTAIYDQLLWLLAHGHEPFSTVVSRPMLADHFQPGLALLTPLYWLDLGVGGLFVAQSVGLALTAPALHALAKAAGASTGLATLPAFLWLLCPWVAAVNLFEFRPSSLAPPLFVLSILAGLKGRHMLLAFSMLVALSLKEDVSLTYIVLGLLLAHSGKQRVGAIVAASSMAWFLGASAIIVALGGSYDAFGRRYAADRGDSIADALRWSVHHPIQTLADIGSQSTIGLLALLLATGGLALLAPLWMLLAAPNALYNALSAYSPQHDLAHHYHLATLVGLFAAAAIGIGRIGSLPRGGRLAIAAAVSLAVAAALPGGARTHTNSSMGIGLVPSETRSALEQIPPDVPIAAARSLLPHLSQRVEVYTLPEPFVQIDWGSSLTSDELARRAARVRFAAYVNPDEVRGYVTGDFEDEAADVRTLLDGLGFVVVAHRGPVEILERRK